MTREEKNTIITDNLLKAGYPIQRIRYSLEECDNSFRALNEVDIELFNDIVNIANSYGFSPMDIIDNYQV